MGEVKVLQQHTGDGWATYNADTVDVCGGLADESIHFSVFSPPFASLYTYSASERDMGNVRNAGEFGEQFRYLLRELYRVTKPGRLCSQHCMLLPTSKSRDGFIGLYDFRGDIIRWMQDAGWIFHSEVAIWKDPVTAMQRTKALGLLHKQIRKDASMSRQGINDYLVTFRKPGNNPEPVSNTEQSFPVKMWQRYASPVWATVGKPQADGFLDIEHDINPSDTLQFRSAREHDDERHICPLQLEVIRRSVRLWTNPCDTVLSPFAGIGSEGFVALEQGRRFVGVELKRSYYEQMVRNLSAAKRQQDLFTGHG